MDHRCIDGHETTGVTTDKTNISTGAYQLSPLPSSLNTNYCTSRESSVNILKWSYNTIQSQNLAVLVDSQPSDGLLPWGANIYSLTVEWLFWYGGTGDKIHPMEASSLKEKSCWTWRRHVHLVVVSLALCQLYLGDFWPVNILALVLWAHIKLVGGTVVSYGINKMALLSIK